MESKITKEQIAEKFLNLEDILGVLQRSTVPVSWHTDPNSIYDCWSESFDILSEIKTKYAAQFKQAEQCAGANETIEELNDLISKKANALIHEKEMRSKEADNYNKRIQELEAELRKYCAMA